MSLAPGPATDSQTPSESSAPGPTGKPVMASRGAPRAVWAALAALYVLLFPYHPKLRSPNELCRLWQSIALVEHGTLDINQVLRDRGYVGDLSVKDGKYYPSKAPLLSFAAAPVYAALRAASGPEPVPEVPLVFFSRLWLTVLPTLGLLWLVRRYLRATLTAPVADALTVTYGLGSLAFSYSLLFMSHQTTAVLLFAGFYALWRCARGEWRERGYVLAGACAGATVAAEYTGALGVLGLVLYAALTFLFRDVPARERLRGLGRAAGLATLGALPFVLALMAYHQATFGHPLTSGYKYLNDSGYQPWHLGGFLGIRTPDPRAFTLSLVSPLRGLFTLAPFLLLAVPGLSRLRFRRGADVSAEQRALAWMTAALLAGYLYFTSSFSYDSWGWTTGPRHLTGLVPFLLLPAGLWLERLRERQSLTALGAGAMLCGAAILTTGLATFVNYIPDDVSNALGGLTLPLLHAGFFPPSVLSFLGVPQSIAGVLLLVLLVAVTGWVLATLSTPPGRRWPALPSVAAGLATLLLVTTLHYQTTEHDDADRNAVRFLESVWLAPPQGHVSFWPRQPH
ncbi:hypothetical protein HUA76_01135 [Myxococcus sp. CA056]|uniref:hypothetical protein n=1 Tax=unclassified Myxococcus TaxID=2648731 RepID=UPI00157ABE8D|nr:hypothetical protein [Myxococcus sp. CA056]NTX37734.1 hypothetical protein [Myxococcus sp. CA033]NTX50620.1 hypothetical protein [Myxococcus sp. CA039A]